MVNEYIVPLSSEDKKALETKLKQAKVILTVGVLLLAGAITLHFFYSGLLLVLLYVLGALGTIGGIVFLKQTQKNSSSGTKKIIRGMVDKLEIIKSGSTFTYTVQSGGMVEIEEKTPGGFVKSEETMTLPIGQKDMRNYVLTLGNYRLLTKREQFFELKVGDEVIAEVLANNELLKLKRVD